MSLALESWLAPIRREYLDTFIPAGGGAVRLVVTDAVIAPMLHARLKAAAQASGLSMISVDTAATRLHLLHYVFFAIASELDWENLIQTRLEALVRGAGYRWPEAGRRCSLAALADSNGIASPLLRATLQRHITRVVWEDAHLAQDFRKAMIALLDARLADDKDSLRDADIDWLRGTIRSLREVRDAQISARIGRHNARAMLVSLCHWLRACGYPGLVLLLDIRRLLRERRESSDGIVYTPAAVMDCYEVIRQIIDDCEHFEGLFLVVVGDARLTNEDVPKQASSAPALKMRVCDDVRPRGLDNPLSPMAVIAP